jgi:hypothetical protein
MALDAKTIEALRNAADEKDMRILEILKRVDPDTYRDYRVLAEKEGELPHVKPGDLITSQLINALIDRINALELGGESILRLGPLAQGAHTLVALAGSPKSGAGLWLDGERVLDKSNEPANAALLDGATLAVKQSLAVGETEADAAFERLMKIAREGDVLMVQVSVANRQADTGEVASVETRQSHTYLGVIAADGQGESALRYLNSIQSAQLPFTWGLYSAKLRRFVLGGASEDIRLQNVLKAESRLHG